MSERMRDSVKVLGVSFGIALVIGIPLYFQTMRNQCGTTVYYAERVSCGDNRCRVLFRGGERGDVNDLVMEGDEYLKCGGHWRRVTK